MGEEADFFAGNFGDTVVVVGSCAGGKGVKRKFEERKAPNSFEEERGCLGGHASWSVGIERGGHVRGWFGRRGNEFE
jgi:hypothetical protein